MPTPKKIPQRMCVGCREMKPKRQLIRVVKPPEGDVHLDLIGKAAGRGAYVCKNPECLKRAVKSRALNRMLSANIAQDVLDALTQSVAEHG